MTSFDLLRSISRMAWPLRPCVCVVRYKFNGVSRSTLLRAPVTSVQSSAPEGHQVCCPVWAGWLGPCHPCLHSCKGGQDERFCGLLTLESLRPVGEPAGKDLYATNYVHNAISTHSAGHTNSLDVKFTLVFVDRGPLLQQATRIIYDCTRVIRDSLDFSAAPASEDVFSRVSLVRVWFWTRPYHYVHVSALILRLPSIQLSTCKWVLGS